MKIAASGEVIIKTELVLKSSDSDRYFKITINDKGEIQVVPLS
jgi:hypothetical protein